MTTEQKLLDACVDYRAKLDVLEAENAALREQLLQKTQLLEQENLRLLSILSRIRNVVDHSPDMSQATRLEWVVEYLDDALGKEAQP